MMTVGLHCRVVAKGGRLMGLIRFLDYVSSFGEDVWIATREQVATHWYQHHYPDAKETMSVTSHPNDTRTNTRSRVQGYSRL